MRNTGSHVELTAPAKVIVAGENAVAFGSTAVVCAVDLTNACSAGLSDDPNFRISIGPEMVEFNKASCCRAFNAMTALCDLGDYGKVERALRKRNLVWVQAALGQLISTDVQIPYFRASIQLAVPLGCGLGGSATVTNLVAQSALALAGQPVHVSQLFRLSSLGDKIAHGGRGTGTDSAAIAYNACVAYSNANGMRFLRVNRPLRFILCDSGEKKSSVTSLSRFRRISDAEPDRFREALEEFGNISADVIRLLEGNPDPEMLGVLLLRNHALLRGLGASTPEIERIVRLSICSGAAGAKITGGGCGGYVLILAEPERIAGVMDGLRCIGKAAFVVETASLGQAVAKPDRVRSSIWRRSRE